MTRCRVRERQHGRRLRRGNLADAVAERQRRANSDLGQCPHARRLNGENHRLGDVGMGEVAREAGESNSSMSDQPARGRKMGIDFRQSLAEGRFAR